ncbi:MAG TPA: hypothetical protein DEQ87_04055, partial [Algoriphagus sp.]|nr:hypothetical protein [Algoriphagus sp.]
KPLCQLLAQVVGLSLPMIVQTHLPVVEQEMYTNTQTLKAIQSFELLVIVLLGHGMRLMDWMSLKGW